ncbi:2'-5' RNA ligase family protein [Kitasatospora sp. NPDC098663]|uniref:2'-5' RNA ligase family protein n=1 Tax=Kitasatospora sp. NPDC098663 TaxID=3364096 RepID=UPI0037F93A8F
MRQFVPSYRGAPWPDGASVLHVYARPDRSEPALARLLAACAQAMAPYPITPQNELLHCTIEMIADTTSDTITEPDRAALTRALTRHLRDTPPLHLTAGSPIANSAGALLDLHPDGDLLALRERVRQAIHETRGPGALLHHGGRPHLSLGYAYDTASSDTLQSALRRISPSHVPLTIDAVELLDVTWTRQPRPAGLSGWTMSWTPVATIPLPSGATERHNA